jgi:hypothetical protein
MAIAQSRQVADMITDLAAELLRSGASDLISVPQALIGQQE